MEGSMITSLMLRCLLTVGVVTLSLLVGTIEPVSAAQRTFNKPMWGGKRLDLCFTWSKNCGQPVADAYCSARGYERAINFDKEPARPTQLIAQRRVCNDAVCEGFKFVTCFTPAAKPGPRREGPRM